jgi:hypothetical protein
MNADIKNPDFIGIGMERAGTSWLFYMLASHPQIWVPPIKELHYFDSLELRENWRFGPHLKMRLRAKFAPLLKTPQARPQYFKNTYAEYLAWDKLYFTGKPSHDWYRALFSERFAKGKLTGEITAAYSTLNDAAIADLARNFDQTKIILSLRDPVDRSVSGLLHHIRAVKGRDISDVTEADMLSWVRSQQTQARSNPVEILKRWQSHIAPERLILIDFAQIAKAPHSLIKRLYRALDVNENFQPPETLIHEKIFSFRTPSDQLPDAVMSAINDLYGDHRSALQTLLKHHETSYALDGLEKAS